MRLKLLRSLWGITDPLESALPKLRDEGFEGVEFVAPRPLDDLRRLLRAQRMDFVGMILTQGETVRDHVNGLRDSLDRMRPLEPLHITCHGGKDAWSRAECEQFYAEALEIERRTGIPIAFETHRGRILYNPWTTRDMLRQFPELKLCCDFSHWVLVCERLIDTEEAIIRLCAERCIHLHARVGYPEGPQVSDPRAPENLPYVEAHERWWDLVWEAQAARGMEVSTLTPEYGPPPYQQTQPHTQTPLADVWAVCRWQAQREQARFMERKGRYPQ